MGIITFNGTASTNYNINVEKCPSYPVPQRVVEKISVLGRNGDLLFDTDSYANVEQEYEVYFNGKSSSFQAKSRDIATWLYGTKGYCRLEDSYDPDVYRMACISQKTDFRNFRNYMGRATLVFDCKPQRFLKSGETPISMNGGSSPSTTFTYTNNYMRTKPLFIVTGNGSVIQYYSQAGEPVQGFTVSNNSGKTMYVDSETMNAVSGNYASPATINTSLSTANYGSVTPSPMYLSMDCGSELWVTMSSLYGTDNLHFTYASTGNVTTAAQTLTNSSQGAMTVAFWRSSGRCSLHFNASPGAENIDFELSISNYVNRNADIKRAVTNDYTAVETFPVLGHGNGEMFVTVSGFGASMVPRWWTL